MPFFWGHENLYSPKPPIVVFEDQDPNFKATDKHFDSLMKRYGQQKNNFISFFVKFLQVFR